MKELLKENLGIVEVGVRFLSGALLLAVIMINSIAPVWFALIAVYPVATAIMSWDPLYAAIRMLRGSLVFNPHKLKAIAVG